MMRSSCFAFFLMVAVAGCSATASNKPGGTHAFLHRVNYSGENFGRIAAWYTGDYENWKSIAEDNPKVSPGNLRIGDEIAVRPSLVIQTTPMPETFLHTALVKPPAAATKSESNGKSLSMKKGKGEKLKLASAKGTTLAEKKANKRGKKMSAKKDTSMKLARARAPRAPIASKPAPVTVAKAVKEEAAKEEPAKKEEPVKEVQEAAAPPPPAAPQPEVAARAEEQPQSNVCRGQSCSKGGATEPAAQDEGTREVEIQNRGGAS